MEDFDGRAERIERRSRRILWASGFAFLAWQLSYFVLFRDTGDEFRNVDKVRTFGLIAWSAALLLLLATGGGAFQNRQVREILDDELTRADRARAYRNAFWAMIAISFIAYVVAQVSAVRAADLAHVMMSTGVVVAVLTLAFLQRRYPP